MSRKAKRATAPSRRDECGALPEPKQAETEKKGRKKPRRHGPRLPGMRGGAVVADRPEPRPYCPHPPHFPLNVKQLLAKCRKRHLLPECLGDVLALMDLMTHCGCTMGHLHDISHVGYATIYDFLSLESFPGTPVHVRLVLPLGADLMEYRCLSYFCLKELEKPKSPKNATFA